jgi:spore coat protein H
MSVNPYLMEKILAITGEKMTISSLKLSYNNQLLNVRSCKTRGNTTLQFRRKSFSVSLDEPLSINKTPVSRLAINNLAMDHNYWRARVCFLLMRKINIFPLANQYAELRLNGQTQGTYLEIQKPEDYARSIGSELLLRRETASNHSVEYSYNIDVRKYKKNLKNSHKLSRVFSGKQLADTLEKLIDLEKYQKWLAFNYLIMNGDYYDELFLFLEPESDRFGIIPWDYDDVFASHPHEGMRKRDQELGDRLLFSSEAAFDMAIAQDEFLYRGYIEEFWGVLSTLTERGIQKVFEQVYQELTPYFLNSQVIEQSKYDHAGLTHMESLQQDLNQHYQFLVRRRNTIYSTLMLIRQ